MDCAKGKGLLWGKCFLFRFKFHGPLKSIIWKHITFAIYNYYLCVFNFLLMMIAIDLIRSFCVCSSVWCKLYTQKPLTILHNYCNLFQLLSQTMTVTSGIVAFIDCYLTYVKHLVQSYCSSETYVGMSDSKDVCICVPRH